MSADLEAALLQILGPGCDDFVSDIIAIVRALQMSEETFNGPDLDQRLRRVQLATTELSHALKDLRDAELVDALLESGEERLQELGISLEMDAPELTTIARGLDRAVGALGEAMDLKLRIRKARGRTKSKRAEGLVLLLADVWEQHFGDVPSSWHTDTAQSRFLEVTNALLSHVGRATLSDATVRGILRKNPVP